MLDDAMTGASAPLPRCMWCSAELPSASEVACPSCGATLIEEAESQVPGVTAIDAEAIIRNARDAKPKQRSRLMSWISGEYSEDEKPAPPGSLSPPPPAVRREMLRLELEARVANLQAEAGAIAAEAAVDSGTPIDLPEVDPTVVAEAALPAENGSVDAEDAATEAASVAPESSGGSSPEDEVPPA